MPPTGPGRAAVHPLLPDFFRTFPNFIRNPSATPEADFRRLQENELWASNTYDLYRRRFILSLATETRSPVHTFFASHASFLEYDSTSAPHVEFDRLKEHSAWSPDDVSCRTAHRLFQQAFKREFNGPLDIFYRGYNDYSYNPRTAPMAEFRSLMAYKGWRPKPDDESEEDELSRKYRTAKGRFFTAFKKEFERHFGSGETIETWQELCAVLGVEPVPDGTSACKKALRPLMVNIYDIVQHKRTGEAFDFFQRLEDLKKYTIDNDLRYPKKRAKEGPFKFLLRRIDR